MRAHLRLELTRTDGAVIMAREADNSVLRSGADLLARLFSGQLTGITHMAVGTSDIPETQDFTTTALTGATQVPLPPEAFHIDAPDAVKRVVRVRVQGTIPAAAAVGILREAALVAQNGNTATLYNRVVFAPIEKAGDHELTLFWEVSFPFGDLQGLL